MRGKLGGIAMLLVATCCDGSDPALRDELLVEAGSPLGPHLVVPDGSRLVGDRFPGAEGSWDALLLIDEDPLDVLRQVLDQLADEQFEVRSRSRGGTCALRRGVVVCRIGAVGGEPRVLYSLDLQWGAQGEADLRHLLVHAEPWGDLWAGNEFPLADLPSDIDAPAAPAPVTEWEPPAANEPVVGGWGGPDIVDLVAGSELVAPPALATCATGGHVAVLRVPDRDDAASVMSEYAEQFGELGFFGETVREDFDGTPVVAARYSTGGGGDLHAVALLRDEGRTVIRLWRCND